MSCCGSRRAALRTPPFRAVAPVAPEPPLPQQPVPLASRAEGAIVVRGAVTGLAYLFGAPGSTLDVDGRDAQALLATGLFQHA